MGLDMSLDFGCSIKIKTTSFHGCNSCMVELKSKFCPDCGKKCQQTETLAEEIEKICEKLEKEDIYHRYQDGKLHLYSSVSRSHRSFSSTEVIGEFLYPIEEQEVLSKIELIKGNISYAFYVSGIEIDHFEWKYFLNLNY